MLLMIFIVIPLSLFLGVRLPGRSYYIMSIIVAIEILIPFFLAFEGSKPKAHDLVTIAVMSAIVIVSRVIIPLPSFKPTFALIMLSGIAFGPEAGFIVGAVSALGSNFFMGQGPYTPWQMMAYGLAGVLAGAIFGHRILPKKNWVMAFFCFICTVIVIGPLLDTSTLFITVSKPTWASAAAIYLSGLPVNLMQGFCGFLTMLLFGNVILEKLDRVKTQYGIMEKDDGI